jgi:hypothetical protein
MRRFEHEPRVLKPDSFDAWLSEIGDVADALGAWALIGAWRNSPTECCRYLITLPGLWDGLIARGRYADRRRYEAGVYAGRRIGL